jgi:hypothetical protein
LCREPDGSQIAGGQDDQHRIPEARLGCHLGLLAECA